MYMAFKEHCLSRPFLLGEHLLGLSPLFSAFLLLAEEIAISWPRIAAFTETRGRRGLAPGKSYAKKDSTVPQFLHIQ